MRRNHVAYALLLVRALLACLLIWNGLPKIRHQHVFLSTIYDFLLVGPKAGILLAVSIPWLQVLAGVLLIGGVFVSGALIASALLALLYLVADISAVYRELPVDSLGSLLGTPVNSNTIVVTTLLLAVIVTAYLLTPASSAQSVGGVLFASARRIARRYDPRGIAWKTALTFGAACGVYFGGPGIRAAFHDKPLAFERSSYEVTGVKEGDTREMDFAFRNGGKSTVNLLDVRSSCSCIRLRTRSYSIAPGESGVIKAHLDTEGITGKHEYRIFVETDAPSQPVCVILLTVTVPARSKPQA